MPFYPTNTVLNSVDEFKNISHRVTYIGYVGSVGTNYPVTITPIDANSTVNVSGDTISGYFSDSFTNDISYRTKQDTFETVNKFEQINNEELYGIYHYDANTINSVTYSYLAEANGQSQVYTIVVTNNWTNNRNLLLKYSNPSKYQEISTTWLNNNGSIVPWNNSLGIAITWENNTWL